MMTVEQRVEQYKICKQRGHKAGIVRFASNPPRDICCFCGTTFWTSITLHEANIPEHKETKDE